MSLALNTTKKPAQGLALETVWREKAQNLGLAQLETTTWEDLHKALDAAAAGRGTLAAKWIDLVEEKFLSTWESYEGSDVLEREVTAESVLGHRFLQEGLEGWLASLDTFRDGLSTGVDRSEVLSLAEEGQRLLMTVQIIEQEALELTERFMAAWAN